MTEFMQNILRGAGMAIDLAPPTRRVAHRLYDPSLSVAEALRRDWARVGQDIKEATEKYGEQAQE